MTPAAVKSSGEDGSTSIETVSFGISGSVGLGIGQSHTAGMIWQESANVYDFFYNPSVYVGIQMGIGGGPQIGFWTT